MDFKGYSKEEVNIPICSVHAHTMESGEIPGESVTVKLPLEEISQIHGKMGSVSAKTRCDDWKIFRRWLFGRGGFFAVSPSRE